MVLDASPRWGYLGEDHVFPNLQTHLGESPRLLLTYSRNLASRSLCVLPVKWEQGRGTNEGRHAGEGRPSQFSHCDRDSGTGA